VELSFIEVRILQNGTTSLESQLLFTKLNMHLAYDLVIPFLSTFPREIKTQVDTKMLHMNVHTTFIHNIPKLETMQYPLYDTFIPQNTKRNELCI